MTESIKTEESRAWSIFAVKDGDVKDLVATYTSREMAEEHLSRILKVCFAEGEFERIVKSGTPEQVRSAASRLEELALLDRRRMQHTLRSNALEYAIKECPLVRHLDEYLDLEGV